MERINKDIYEHIVNSKSTAEFIPNDSNIASEEGVRRALTILDAVSYGGFGDYAITIREALTEETVKRILETGTIELEVGMGQRSIPVDNPIYKSVWGPGVEYIPWPDSSQKFKLGKSGNKIVSLKLIDLSRAQEDRIIE